MRKPFLIKKGVVAKNAIWVFLVCTITCLGVGIDTYLTIKGHVGMTLGEPDFQLLLSNKDVFLLVSRALIYVLCGLFLSVFVYSRFAGPVYKFERALYFLSSGNLVYRMRIRRTDSMRELEQEFNNMAEAIHSGILKDRNLAKRVSARLEELANRCRDSAPNLANNLNELKIEVDHITAEFKI